MSGKAKRQQTLTCCVLVEQKIYRSVRHGTTRRADPSICFVSPNHHSWSSAVPLFSETPIWGILQSSFSREHRFEASERGRRVVGGLHWLGDVFFARAGACPGRSYTKTRSKHGKRKRQRALWQKLKLESDHRKFRNRKQ